MSITRQSRFIFLFLLLGATCSITSAQTPNPKAEDKLGLLAPLTCKDAVPAEVTLCAAVLPLSVNAKNSKTGDAVLIKLGTMAGVGEQLVAQLDASVVEARPAANGLRSVLRIRIQKVLDKQGHQIPVQARIVAVVSPSAITQRWAPPPYIAERFPHSPSDEERLPGERKYSEEERHTSPLDSSPDFPVPSIQICHQKDPCVDLPEAKGIYGYEGVTLEPPDAASPVDSVFNANKTIKLFAGTYLVLEWKKLANSADVTSRAPLSHGPLSW
jgi:hypothetical protein